MLDFARLTRKQFKENPDAWLLVDKILSDAQYPQTKCTYMPLEAWWLDCWIATDKMQTSACRCSTMSS